jgi:hypothetical protein
VKNTPRRIRNMHEARAYVAGVVSSLLENEFANGSEWLHMQGFHGGEGGLANLASERRAHRALQEMIAAIDAKEDRNERLFRKVKPKR